MIKIVMKIMISLLILILSGCGKIVKQKEMSIEIAQLSKAEKEIVKLVGHKSSPVIYDFKLDKNVKSIQVNLYELVDGEWKIISGGGGQTHTDKKGRIHLGFDNLEEGLRIAIQSENFDGANEYAIDPKEDFTGTRATSILNDSMDIVYEEEIPLVVQTLTTNSSFSTYEPEVFYTPEQYEKEGYEHIYAITIRFSKLTVGEIDIIPVK